ncbi:MAG: S-layer homology domain-containing protein [Syntrophomonadaceae bacterium]|nr:S-layer homology domain-containing protein [Syntrophomonadaceae bacterium]
MKRLTILIVICLLAGMVFSTGVYAAPVFTDTNNHWAEDYIVTVANAGYVSGYLDGSFKPDKVVTRAEFASVLVRCLGYEPSTGTNYFSDMKSHWAKGYVNKAVALGILIPGDYGDNFGPNTGLKRSEICAMLVRALGGKPDNSPTDFKDNDAISKSILSGYIKVACDLKLLSGYPNGNFEPFQEVTRAQMCKVVINFMDAQDKSLDVPSNENNTDNNTNNNAVNQNAASFSTLAIGDQIYRLDVTPISFQVGLNKITANSLSVQSGYLYINNQYRFALDSAVNDLDVIVGNTRFDVNQLSLSNDRLVIFPGDRRLASVTYDNKKYQSDYVDLFLNSANTNKYLSDMVIIDEYTVKIGDKQYDLKTSKVSIKLSDLFYDVNSLTLSASSTTPTLSKTDRLIASGYSLSNISAIFVGTTSINTSAITSLSFIINGESYSLASLTIDASGNFNIGDETIPCTKVIMIMNGSQYKIDHVSFIKEKLIFYCNETTTTDMVIINDIYRDASGVKILKDNVAYEMDQVMIISRNLVRIGGKQYTLSSTTLKVSYDSKIYTIERIDYNNSLQMPEIDTSSTAETSSQPVKYVFYLNNSLHRDGISDSIMIYTNRKWITFDQIVISDPSHYTVSGTSYALIGAKVMIDTSSYSILDTAWHGSTQVLDIYLTQ